MEFLGLNINQLIAITIFAISMIIIISEKVHRSTVAICGAMLCLIFGVVQFSDPENPASYGDRFDSIIDVNTLGVLFGMMLFVAVIKQSGIFEFLAIKCAKLACGNP
jgi:Na+/H+ antiporter NhaD/arsenite permease-like protein